MIENLIWSSCLLLQEELYLSSPGRKSVLPYLQYRLSILQRLKQEKKIILMKRFLQDLGLKQNKFVVHCDSHNAINLSKNAAYYSQTKHINVRYHWIRQTVAE